MDSDTLAWYESHAENYVERTESLRFFDGLERDLLSFAELLRPGSIVVDLGSGSGRDARFLAGLGHTVVAIDASAGLLRRCLAGPQVPERIHGVNADMLALPVAEQSVGGIWACGSLLHLTREEIPRVIGRCFEILEAGAPIGWSMKEGDGSERRPDGRLFTYTNKHEMCTWLQGAGFSLVDSLGPVRNEWLLVLAVRPRAAQLHESGSQSSKTRRMPPRGSGTSPCHRGMM
ncbi:class I SAM-dependent methyltransferase [Nocardia sp. NPDC003482]